MRVYLYSRVSKPPRKAKEGEILKHQQDTENQSRQLRAFAERQGWEIAGEYTDRMTGKRSDRPEMERLMRDAVSGGTDIVMAWALDRFTREGVSETFAYIQRLKRAGVEFWSLTEEHFRTTGPTGELMIAIAAWIAKQEARRISERTIAGLERARAAGKVLGRPRVVFDRHKAVEMRRQGGTLTFIAKELGTSVSSVARVVAAC